MCKEHGTCLLNLPDFQTFHADAKQVHLDTLPFPPLLSFTIIELDVLHTLYHLYQTALFKGRLVETTDIKLPAVAHEGKHPDDVECITHDENTQYSQVIVGQYTHKYDEIEQGKDNVHRIAEQE